MNDLYFVGQKIVNLMDKNKTEYELLLRSHSVPGFPAQKYAEYIQSEKKHNEYLEFLQDEVQQILEINPKQRFALNLDQQELEYEDTFKMLAAIDEKLRPRLMIEITELPPLEQKTKYDTAINIQAFERISNLGYQLSLDDVTQGNNSIGNLLYVVPYLKQMKWSYIHVINKATKEEVEYLIQLLNLIAQQYHLNLVIEGVEDREISEWLFDNNINNQQGYLFAKPAGVEPIALVTNRLDLSD